MIRNMQIRSKLIAVLVIPLVALTVLAALGIGANVARGVQADRVNDQTAFAVSLSTLVHELQRERDLSAGWVGSGRDAGYGGVVAQRVAVNQALQTFRRDVESSTRTPRARRSGGGSTAAVRRFERARRGAPADRGRTRAWTVASGRSTSTRTTSPACSPSSSSSPARPTTAA